jgi:tetratricopeptide (TPR) repeat protein
VLVVLAVIGLGVWTYSNSFSGVFVFDDARAIVENPNIKHLWPLTRAMAAPRDVTVSGRPVASLTLALNYALAPADVRDVMNPGGPGAPPDTEARYRRNLWGYHALNLALHLLAALVLFGIVRRTLISEPLRERFGASSTSLACAIALIWLVHPLHTQAVTYIVQRVESLMGLFFLLTLYGAIRAAEPGPQHGYWMCGSVAACALGMGSKEVMVAAPIVVWLWDRLFGPHDHHGHRWALYASLASTWIILALLVASDPRPNSAGIGVGGWTWWAYLRTQAGVVFHYLRLAAVPVPLVFDYDWPQTRSLAAVAPQAAVLAVLAGFTVIALFRRWPAGFLGAWFFGILAPTSSVLPIPTEVAAEHRMYLPVAAVISLVVLGVFYHGRHLLQKIGAHGVLGRRGGLVAGLVLAGAVTATFAGLTHARNRDYWSVEALARDTLRKRPANARVRVMYGVDLLAARRYGEAEAQLRAALQFDAGRAVMAQVHMYLGSALCAQGKVGEGIPHLVKALDLDSALKEADALLGEAYSDRGEFEPALKHFTRALEALPDNTFLLNRMAWMLATSPRDDVRNGTKAVELAERAVRLTAGQDVISLDTLAACYAEQDRFAEAAATSRRALDLARAQGNRVFIPELEQHLALYEARQKLRIPS